MAAGTAVAENAAFAEAHRDLLSDSSIQFELKPADPPQPLWNPFAGWERLLEVLFWIFVAAAALFILYLLWDRFGRHWRKEPEDAPGEAWRPDAAPARALLAEADALAGQGRFAEAVRLLLFRSIEDIEKRLPDLLRPALTSRDIAALHAIPAAPRDAFASIADRVERSVFARRPLAEADWQESRSAYQRFAFAAGWRR